MAEPADIAAPALERRGIWSDVREALRGSEQDYTKGPIGRAILLLAIPTTDWRAPDPESRATVRITGRSSRRWRLATSTREPRLKSRLNA